MEIAERKWHYEVQRKWPNASGRMEMVLLETDRNQLFSHLARQIVINTMSAPNLRTVETAGTLGDLRLKLRALAGGNFRDS